MMVSIHPTPPHLTPPVSGGAGPRSNNATTTSSNTPSLRSSGTATPTTPTDILAYTGMSLLSDLEIPVPPSLDPALLPSAMVANHLRAARLRLLPDLPGSFHGFSNNSSMWSWWCRVCGALPEGWTATEKGTPTGSGSRTPGGRKKKKRGGQKGVSDATEIGTSPALERSLKRALEALNPDSDGQLPPARRPPSSPLDRRRKPAACDSCGSTFTRPRPTITLPPARLLARNREAAAAAASAASDTVEPSPVHLVIQVTNTPVFEWQPASSPESSAPASSEAPTPPLFNPEMIRAPPLNLWNIPSLQHIPTSPGDLPTYPLPPVIPPPSPNGSSPPVKIPPGGGQAPPPKKRKKKSGLAKLLAQNAEREAENKGSGNWGLG